MPIKDRIVADLTAAMKAKDAFRLGVLRMLKSKIMEAEVSERAARGLDYSLDDDATTAVLSSYAKQRRDSIEAYRKGRREDLAEKEEAEVAVIQQYLPAQLSEEQIRKIVGEAIGASGASSLKDLGAVMKLVTPRTRGVADGKLVSQIAREMLGASQS